MSTLHFVGGEKGGVGKSCVSRLLAQHFIDLNVPFVIRDGDQSHGDMMRFYADYSESVNLEDGEGMDEVFETALETDQHILVDLPSQSERLLKRWMDEGGIIELAEQEGIALVFWHVMDDGINSVDLLERLLDNYAGSNNVRFVVVKNHGRGFDFSFYEHSPVHGRAAAHGAQVVSLGGLNPKVMNKIDRLNLSFWAATQLEERPCLTKLERQKVQVWSNNWRNELRRISGLLSTPAN